MKSAVNRELTAVFMERTRTLSGIEPAATWNVVGVHARVMYVLYSQFLGNSIPFSQFLGILRFVHERYVFFVYNSQDVANRIKETAYSRKISVTQLLADCELSKNTLSSMQSGGFLPRLEAICKIADRLDVSIDYLVGRTDDPVLH